jgi:hypothetical protein
MADPQLIAYITAQTQAGYPREQIRQALLANGYPALAVEAALREGSPQRANLQAVASAQQMAQQGFTAPQATQGLESQGYSRTDARVAVRTAYGIGAPSGSHHLVVVLFLIVAVLVGAGGMYLLLGGQSTPPINTNSSVDGNTVVDFSPNEIIAGVVNIAHTQGKDDAVRACFSRRLPDYYRDTCLLDVAVIDTIADDTICDQIQDPKIHDTCLLTFIDTNRFESVCARVQLVSSKETCGSIRSLRTTKGA